MCDPIRTESTRLRDEQDREYRAFEEADRRNRELREREDVEQRQREAQESQQRELHEAIELSNRLTKDNRILQCRQSLNEEPPAGPDVSALRFQLPKGIKASRRFLKTDKIQVFIYTIVVSFLFKAYERKRLL